MSIDVRGVKGTRDFYPDEMRLRNWLFGVWRDVSQQFGFEEYDACLLEYEELYTRKAGEEITEQIYAFPDKAGRHLSLRPEMTPSLARMVLQQQKALSFPLKWFSIPQCFRYERMMRGRRREHFQWNADIIGESSVTAEAEIISLLLSGCKNLGLTAREIRLFFNDRRVLNEILTDLEVPESLHDKVMIVMDKRDKISEDAFIELLQKERLTHSQIKDLIRFLAITGINELAEKLGGGKAMESLQNVMETVNQAGFGEYLKFDISIVRGLSYYTGVIFELKDVQKGHRSICGGGRYDSLLSTYGGDTIPAVGFGFGDIPIIDLLSDLNRLPELSRHLDFMVVPFSAQEKGMALAISNNLRQQGARVECDYSLKKIKRALQRADELNVHKVVLLFPEELAKGEVVLRDMKTRQQKNIFMEDLLLENQ